MSKNKACQLAITKAVEKLSAVDLNTRCPALGLAVPVDNKLAIRAFGHDMVFSTTDFSGAVSATNAAVSLMDRILILHYLLYDQPIKTAGDFISYRDFPGGQFYWNSFVARSTAPLVGHVGNNLELLKRKLLCYDTQPLDIGDCGAKIHVVGAISVGLIYRLGDEEFGPSADMVFDGCANKIYNAEDAAVLAGRVCFGLIR